MDRRPDELSECLVHWRHGRICQDGPQRVWSSFGFTVSHQGFVITAMFHPDHPYEAPLVRLSPRPESHHYYIHGLFESEARLCYLRPEQWSPRLRLNFAVASAMRFINDYLAGDPATR